MEPSTSVPDEAWATVSVITAQGDEGPAGATANALSSSRSSPLALVCST
jgi:hypothetical protein